MPSGGVRSRTSARRRVTLGPDITLVFENHATMFFQVHEMLRAEGIVDVDAIRDELTVYNDLLPKPGELSATMLIELTDESEVRARLDAMIGIDEHVHLRIGAVDVSALFESGRSREDRLSAVQYLRFPIAEKVGEAAFDPSCEWRLIAAHPNYRAQALLFGEVRAALEEDLRG